MGLEIFMKEKPAIMKRAIILLAILMSMIGSSACAADTLNTSPDRPEKMYEDVAVEDFRQIHISGSASSIVIQRSESENLEFYNGDLNPVHTYTVRCDKDREILNIELVMENSENDNDVLGSPMIYIPQKEFDKIEIDGNFRQVSLDTINSDVLIHANDSHVNLNLEADHLNHNITLDGSESDTFRSVSVYFDKFPDNVKMDLNLIEDGTINDPDDILKKEGLESGSGKPVVSVNYAQEINIYSEE